MIDLIRILNKYIIVLLIWTIFDLMRILVIPMLIKYGIIESLNPGTYSLLNSFPILIIIKVVIFLFIVFDMKKYELNHFLLTSISALFFPLLGIIVLSIILIEKQNNVPVHNK